MRRRTYAGRCHSTSPSRACHSAAPDRSVPGCNTKRVRGWARCAFSSGCTRACRGPSQPVAAHRHERAKSASDATARLEGRGKRVLGRRPGARRDHPELALRVRGGVRRNARTAAHRGAGGAAVRRRAGRGARRARWPASSLGADVLRSGYGHAQSLSTGRTVEADGSGRRLTHAPTARATKEVQHTGSPRGLRGSISMLIPFTSGAQSALCGTKPLGGGTLSSWRLRSCCRSCRTVRVWGSTATTGRSSGSTRRQQSRASRAGC